MRYDKIPLAVPTEIANYPDLNEIRHLWTSGYRANNRLISLSNFQHSNII